jgi:hypothetical protein
MVGSYCVYVREMAVDPYEGGVVYVMGIHVVEVHVYVIWVVGRLRDKWWRLSYVDGGVH